MVRQKKIEYKSFAKIRLTNRYYHFGFERQSTDITYSSRDLKKRWFHTFPKGRRRKMQHYWHRPRISILADIINHKNNDVFLVNPEGSLPSPAHIQTDLAATGA